MKQSPSGNELYYLPIKHYVWRINIKNIHNIRKYIGRFKTLNIGRWNAIPSYSDRHINTR